MKLIYLLSNILKFLVSLQTNITSGASSFDWNGFEKCHLFLLSSKYPFSIRKLCGSNTKYRNIVVLLYKMFELRDFQTRGLDKMVWSHDLQNTESLRSPFTSWFFSLRHFQKQNLSIKTMHFWRTKHAHNVYNFMCCENHFRK